METIDDEVLEKAEAFIKKAEAAGQPWFVWFNTTHMHFRTHCKPESKGQAGRWQSECVGGLMFCAAVVGLLRAGRRGAANALRRAHKLNQPHNQ
jgi:hypothetical protein